MPTPTKNVKTGGLSMTTKQKRAKKKKSSSKSSSFPSGDALVSKALGFLDQATEILREGIASGANQSLQIRSKARKKAHLLVEKAHVSLGEALNKGTSLLHKVLSKM